MKKTSATVFHHLCLQDTARRIAKVSAEAKMDIEEDAYVEGFKPHMMDVVHAWCKGATFAQICRMTDIFEGRCWGSETTVLWMLFFHATVVKRLWDNYMPFGAMYVK